MGKGAGPAACMGKRPAGRVTIPVTPVSNGIRVTFVTLGLNKRYRLFDPREKTGDSFDGDTCRPYHFPVVITTLGKHRAHPGMATTAPHMLEQHLAEVMAGQALDPAWHLEAEDCAEATFDALACERLAVAAPTDYLAGFWFARALARREVQAMIDHPKD